MNAFKINLNFAQGATFRKLWMYTAGPTKDTAVPVNLAGYTARSQIRKEVESTDVLHELTTENGGITLGADGSIRLFISHTDTESFSWEEGVYDLELIAPDGDIRRFAQGRACVSREVTR